MFSWLSIVSFYAAVMLLWLGQQTLVAPADTLAHAFASALVGASVLCCGLAVRKERHTLGYAKSLGLSLTGLLLWQVQPLLLSSPWARLALPLVQACAPALLALGALPALATAWALYTTRESPTPDVNRVRGTQQAALAVAYCCITFAALNLASHTYNHKWDVSYFKVTKVSAATAHVAAGLNQKVTLTLFFPPGNDVLEQVRGYIDSLRQQSPWLESTILDQAVEPERARALKVRRNGVIAIHSGNKTELLRLDIDVEQARAGLRRLDSAMRQHLLSVSEPQGIVYVTDGHGERVIAADDDTALSGLQDFKIMLQNNGFILRPLGLAEGLGRDIPQDAALVAIMGPRRPFAPQEIKTLGAYLQRGGHLLLCLDPDRDTSDESLAKLVQVHVTSARVGNEHYQVRAANGGPSPFNLVTVRVGSHPSVKSLEAHPGRLGMIFLGASHVSRATDALASVMTTPVVLGMPDSFIDLNGNGSRDDDGTEPPRQDITLAMAVQWPGPTEKVVGRALVVGDVDVAVDGIIRNVGNSALLTDGVNWLVGATGPALTNNEEDVPIVHRKDQDVVWFYGVSFVVPLMVFALGLVVHERDGKRVRRLPNSGPHGYKEAA